MTTKTLTGEVINARYNYMTVPPTQEAIQAAAAAGAPQPMPTQAKTVVVDINTPIGTIAGVQLDNEADSALGTPVTLTLQIGTASTTAASTTSSST